MASAFEKWADGHLNVATWKAGKEAWDAALEEAAKIAESEGNVPREDGGNISRWDACDNVARGIRELKEQK